MPTPLTNYGPKYFDQRTRSIAFGDLMSPDQIHEAEAPYRAFLEVKPDPPEHAAFVARAVHAYPKLPVGAAHPRVRSRRSRTHAAGEVHRVGMP